jgi:hypothetical protein
MEIQKVKATLEYFFYMIVIIAEVWSCCSSRSDGDMLQMWFSYNPFMLSEHGVKMDSPQGVCTKDRQHTIVHLLVSEGMKAVEVH